MSDLAGNSEKERRKNAALRALIDELLFRVRDVNQNVDMWTPEERQKAEHELSMIMARVRGAAMHETTN